MTILILAIVAAFLAYALGDRRGYARGLNRGKSSYREMLERVGSHYGSQLVAVIALGALFAGVARAQVTTLPPAPAFATLAPQVIAAGDSIDHIDLHPRGSAGLALRVLDAGGNRVTKYTAGWTTTDPNVASVIAGTVTARARGEAMITATVTAAGSTIRAALLVCVSDSAGPIANVFMWPSVTGQPPEAPAIVAAFMDSAPRARRPIADGSRGDTVRFFVAPAGSSPQWPAAGGYPFSPPALSGFSPACIHWRSSAPAIATVDRRGLVTIQSRTGEAITPGMITARYGAP